MNMVEVANLAYGAGIRNPLDLDRAVAVAFAESGGNPKAHNTRYPDDSYGLWQINMRKVNGIDPAKRRQEFGIATDSQLLDPTTNAKAMFIVSGGGKNWKPWSTYGGLRYLAFLPPAHAAAQAALVGLGAGIVEETATETVDAATEAARAAAGGVVKVGKWVSDRNNWFRVAKVGIGVGLIYGGLAALARGYATKAIAPIVGAVAPVGKAVKAAKAVGGMVKS